MRASEAAGGRGASGATPYGLGARIRRRRDRAGISLRELARRVGVSASLVSQIETGKVQPSVSTLYALVSELGGSFDELLFGQTPAPATPQDVPGAPDDPLSATLVHSCGPAVQRAQNRKALQLNRGVRWERLTPHPVPGAEFLYVVYQPEAQSGPPGTYQRHAGREWCYVVSGTLHILVGSDNYVLEAGDAIMYDSTTPHRLTNEGSVPVETVWFQLG